MDTRKRDEYDQLDDVHAFGAPRGYQGKLGFFISFIFGVTSIILCVLAVVAALVTGYVQVL